MFVLISGKQGSGKHALSEALKTFWGSRGVAVYTYDYFQPLYQMHDAVFMMGKEFGLEAGKTRDARLIQTLASWGRQQAPDFWAKMIAEKVRTVTDPWDNKSFTYRAVIPGLSFKEDLAHFPMAFKVRLEAGRDIRQERARGWGDENHELETNLDDYARMGLFDLTINTEKMMPEEAAELIAKTINEKSTASFTKIPEK